MAVQDFDKLNILKRHSEPFEDYFKPMLLSPAQKKARMELAFDLEDALIIFFDYLQTMINREMLNEVADKQQLTYLIYDVVADKDYFKNEEEMNKYVSDIVDETYKATVDNLAKYPNDMSYDGKTQYWVSEDRAMFIAENEANTLLNESDYNKALKEGKQWKTWGVIPDDRVRETHIEMISVTLPIEEYFEVGDAIMLYPKDVTSYFSTGAEHPEEVVNCRCSCRYF